MTTHTFHNFARVSSPGLRSGLQTWGRTILLVGVLAILLGAVLASTAALVAGSLVAVVGAFLLSCRELSGPQRVE